MSEGWPDRLHPDDIADHERFMSWLTGFVTGGACAIVGVLIAAWLS